MDKVKFTEMKYGTKEDYDLLSKYEEGFVEGLSDRILQFLKNLDGSLDGYQITRLEHSLQTATRAAKDGTDEEMIVAALLHDRRFKGIEVDKDYFSIAKKRLDSCLDGSIQYRPHDIEIFDPNKKDGGHNKALSKDQAEFIFKDDAS